MPTYVTLVASLPTLPDFERAKRLPINRERLDRRLLMLTPEDRAEARRAEAFLTWQRQPRHLTDGQILGVYRDVAEHATRATLLELVTARLRRRTIQAALRRRHLGGPPPEVDGPWGLPELIYTIRRNWGRADFGLGALHRWIGPMVEHLRTGNALALERLLMRHSWDGLEALMARVRPRFSFDAVLIYLFQWDILDRWIAYEPERANERFEALIEEALDGIQVA